MYLLIYIIASYLIMLTIAVVSVRYIDKECADIEGLAVLLVFAPVTGIIVIPCGICIVLINGAEMLICFLGGRTDAHNL